MPDIRSLLELNLGPNERRLHAPLVDALQSAHDTWKAARASLPHAPYPDRAAEDASVSGIIHRKKVASPGLNLFHFLQAEIDRLREHGERLRHDLAEFTARVGRASTTRERQDLILDHARSLGATPRQLRADQRAFRRWFDEDALAERYQRRLAENERRLAFCLGRAGALAGQLVREAPGYKEDYWDQLGLEKVIAPLFDHEGDHRLVLAACRALAAAVAALPPDLQADALTEE